jgi:hypothetical protein
MDVLPESGQERHRDRTARTREVDEDEHRQHREDRGLAEQSIEQDAHRTDGERVDHRDSQQL